MSCRNQPQAINIAGGRHGGLGSTSRVGASEGRAPRLLNGLGNLGKAPWEVGISAKAGEGLSLRPSEGGPGGQACLGGLQHCRGGAQE